jgi:hypothetical protein
MKKFTSVVLSLSLALAYVAAFAGCDKTSTTKSTTTATSPEGGKTTVEHTDTVKQSGENPPPANR